MVGNFFFFWICFFLGVSGIFGERILGFSVASTLQTAGKLFGYIKHAVYIVSMQNAERGAGDAAT